MRFAPTTVELDVSGAGRPVIFIPGFACHGSVWDRTVDHLGGRAEAHVATIAGFAGVPAVTDPSLANVHADLARYVVDNQLESPVIIGHSLGGTMALWLAETVPGVGAVVDVEGFPFLAGVGDDSMTESRATAQTETFAQHLRSMTSEQLGAWIRASMGGMFTHEADRDRVLDLSVKSDAVTVAQLFLEGKSRDLRPGMEQITAPVTLVVAVEPGADIERDKAPWRTQTAAIPNLDLVYLAGNHFIMYDQPDHFHAIVDRVIGLSDLSDSGKKSSADG